MKDDSESGEAEGPAGKPPSRETVTGADDENAELAWAKKHVSQGWSGLGDVFRKTELHDRPPGTGGLRPSAVTRTRQDPVVKKILARLDAIDNRLDEIEDRIDHAVGRLNQRIHAIETKEAM